MMELEANAKVRRGGLPTVSHPSPDRGQQLLVVDDDEYVRHLLASALRFAGFVVDVCDDGRTALDRVAALDPALILLDVMMPDLDGIEVCRRLRAAGVTTPVIFVTARDASEDKVVGLTQGGDDYVTKPFDLDELVARIDAVLKRTTMTEATPRRHEYGGIVLDDDAHRVWADVAARRTLTDGVPPAAVPVDERRTRRVEVADPQPRLGLRLRRQRGSGRDVHLLSPAQARRRGSDGDPDRARRGLRAASRVADGTVFREPAPRRPPTAAGCSSAVTVLTIATIAVVETLTLGATRDAADPAHGRIAASAGCDDRRDDAGAVTAAARATERHLHACDQAGERGHRHRTERQGRVLAPGPRWWEAVAARSASARASCIARRGQPFNTPGTGSVHRFRVIARRAAV